MYFRRHLQQPHSLPYLTVPAVSSFISVAFEVQKTSLPVWVQIIAALGILIAWFYLLHYSYLILIPWIKIETIYGGEGIFKH